MNMLICKVPHVLTQNYFFSTVGVKKVKNKHPLGDIYIDPRGHVAAVRSGFDWLTFDTKFLPKLEKAAKNFTPDDICDETYRQQAVDELRKILQIGSHLFSIKVERKRNGAVAVAFLVYLDGKITNISSTVSTALYYEWSGLSGGVWASTDYGIVCRLSHVLHGYESKGRNPNSQLPTERRFKAGYSLRWISL